MDLHAGRYSEGRRRVPHRVVDIAGRTVTTGKQQQLRALRRHLLSCSLRVLGGGVAPPDGADNPRRETCLAANVLPHLSGIRYEFDRIFDLREDLESFHRPHRGFRCRAQAPGFAQDFSAIASFQTYPSSHTRNRIDNDSQLLHTGVTERDRRAGPLADLVLAVFESYWIPFFFLYCLQVTAILSGSSMAGAETL